MVEKQQIPLFPLDEGVQSVEGSLPGQPSSAELWPAELTRRLRVLLHTTPLDALHLGDSRRDPETRHYDALALALRVLDEVIDRLGLEDEADRETVARALKPLLMAMDETEGITPSEQRHEAMVDRVLGALRNDDDARRPFRQEYTSIEEGRAVRRQFEFRLLSDRHHLSGRTVLSPSSEACNLYLRLLDVDVEDAQAAAEAVVQSQLDRGRFDEAVHSARQARIQSLRFRDKIQQVIQATIRDVEQVDWHVEIPTLLREGVDHLERRLRVERGILDTAEGRLDTIEEEDSEGRRSVARVAELVRDCQLRHTELHGHLMGARNVFLDSQARQSFVEGPSLPLPNLLSDVLEPILQKPVAQVVPLIDQSVPLLIGASAPDQLSVSMLVDWMLQPRRPQPAREVPAEPIDPTDLVLELLKYPREIQSEARDLLAAVDTATRLSEILAISRAQRVPDPVLEALTLLALQAFSSEERNQAAVATEPVPGEVLSDPMFYGDELLIQPWRESYDDAP
jgi:hypothetical protein